MNEAAWICHGPRDIVGMVECGVFQSKLVFLHSFASGQVAFIYNLSSLLVV